MGALNPMPRWQRRGVFASVALLVASGLAWLAVHWSVGAGSGELPHPAEAWLMKLHGAATMASLFFFGSVVAGHSPRGWRMQRQRKVGAALWVLLGLIVGSGYLLYYFAPENAREAIGLVHAALGTALTVLVLWHRRGSRRSGHHLRPHGHAVHPHAAHSTRARRHHVERP